MARKVKWTEIAWSDLVEVFDYIAKDSHYYAAGFVSEVRDSALYLSYRITLSKALTTFARNLPGFQYQDQIVSQLF